jgi:uncharacterized protein
MLNVSSEGQTEQTASYVCFHGSSKIAAGSLAEVALMAWDFAKSNPTTSTLTFDRRTGKVIDLNMSGSRHDIVARYALKDEAVAKRGRPKLGVVAREITLMPRHWEWLGQQPGGASVTLRKLVDAARKSRTTDDETRQRIAAAYNFMFAMAGDLPLFEEASRTLFAQDFAKLETCTANWPADIRNELTWFLQGVLPQLEPRSALS